jgi:hypothetical protein
MSGKKLDSVLNLIEIAENNLKTAKSLLAELNTDKTIKSVSENKTPTLRSTEEAFALEVVEGHFDGESMIGDNGKVYPVPQNYASKTQLVVGDRMKWILTAEKEVFKLIQPAQRERVTGTFAIEGENFVALVDNYPASIKILKASATYAMKQLGLKPGDEVAMYIPKDTTPTWGAFINVVKSGSMESKTYTPPQSGIAAELDALSEFGVDDSTNTGGEKDYF